MNTKYIVQKVKHFVVRFRMEMRLTWNRRWVGKRRSSLSPSSTAPTAPGTFPSWKYAVMAWWCAASTASPWNASTTTTSSTWPIPPRPKSFVYGIVRRRPPVDEYPVVPRNENRNGAGDSAAGQQPATATTKLNQYYCKKVTKFNNSSSKVFKIINTLSKEFCGKNIMLMQKLRT